METVQHYHVPFISFPRLQLSKVPLIRQFTIPPSAVDNHSKSPKKVNHSYYFTWIDLKWFGGEQTLCFLFIFLMRAMHHNVWPFLEMHCGNLFMTRKHWCSWEKKKVKHKSKWNFRRYECMNINTNPDSKVTKYKLQIGGPLIWIWRGMCPP